MISVQEALTNVTFTRGEEVDVEKLEAAVDANIFSKFDGAPFNFLMPEKIAPKVAHAVRRRYEESGNWRVAVSWLDADGKQCVFGPQAAACIFNFAPIFFTSPLKPRAVESKLPPVARAAQVVSAVAPGKRLLVRMPTRQRPAQALSVLQKYREMAGAPVAIEVIIDEDDATMLACDVQQRLAALGCVVTVGQHKSKVAACNGGRVREWDVMMLASDDMVPLIDGYAARVLSAMEEKFPHLDGMIYFDDGHQGENLCTLPIFGRRLYDQFGYVYEPAYTSLFCDTEQTGILKELGRIAYVNERIIEHRHHVWGVAKKDELYERNDALWERDKAVFETRMKLFRPGARLPFNSPPLRLSICICSLPDRRAQLEWLLESLWGQILNGSAWRREAGFVLAGISNPREVEVLVDSRVEPTIGEKRQALLERAKGNFVAFVDDDDGIAPDYIERVLGALHAQPDADCAALVGEMTTAGAAVERFEHSIKHREWRDEGGQHFRGPNHLNAIRREIALKAGFPSKNHGEDLDYSVRLRDHLRVEASTGERPIYWYWYTPKASAQ